MESAQALSKHSSTPQDISIRIQEGQMTTHRIQCNQFPILIPPHHVTIIDTKSAIFSILTCTVSIEMGVKYWLLGNKVKWLPCVAYTKLQGWCFPGLIRWPCSEVGWDGLINESMNQWIRKSSIVTTTVISNRITGGIKASSKQGKFDGWAYW